MPRRHEDPVVKVIDYFETATEDAAKTAYEIAGATLRRRFPVTAAKKPTARKARTTKPNVPGPASSVGE